MLSANGVILALMRATGASPTTEPSGTTHPPAAYTKDVAASAAVLGGMGAAWLFWGSSQADAPWALILRLAAPVGIVLAIIAVMRRLRAPGRSMHDSGSGGNRFWNIAAGLELAAIVAGAFVLVQLGHPMLVICWAHLIMGIHWLPMIGFYRIRSLAISGVVAIVLSVVGAVNYFATGGWPGLIVGGLGGLAMILMSGYQLATLPKASDPRQTG